MLSDVLLKWHAWPEDAMQLYTDVFRLGEGRIQCDGEAPGKFKSNPIVLGHSGGKGGRMHRKIMFEDTFEQTLAEFQQMDWAYMSACTYFGRQNSAAHQGKLWALVFDIDAVTDETLNNFMSGAIMGGAYPVPQHVVLSGHGVHLYYVLDEPLDLYPDTKTQVKELKFALTGRLWNRYTSTDENVQHQGINQGFRLVGSHTKKGAPIERAEAWRTNVARTSIEELNRYVDEEFRVDPNRREEGKLSLVEAREKWPEWYERVVVGGERLQGQWFAKEDLYRWWLRKISSGATYGHRYFCVMALAIFAAKCGIYDRDRIYEDAKALLPYFNSIRPDHPFTEADVWSALDCLDERYARFPRDTIEKLTAIQIPANKRNGRRQEVHLARARALRDFDYPDGTWREGGGRPRGSGVKRDLVRDYAAAHPDANHSQIARELGISRPTVIKWLRTS